MDHLCHYVFFILVKQALNKKKTIDALLQDLYVIIIIFIVVNIPNDVILLLWQFKMCDLKKDRIVKAIVKALIFTAAWNDSTNHLCFMKNKNTERALLFIKAFVHLEEKKTSHTYALIAAVLVSSLVP